MWCLQNPPDTCCEFWLQFSCLNIEIISEPNPHKIICRQPSFSWSTRLPIASRNQNRMWSPCCYVIILLKTAAQGHPTRLKKWNLRVTQLCPTTFTGRCQQLAARRPRNYSSLGQPGVPSPPKALVLGHMPGTGGGSFFCEETGLSSQLNWPSVPGIVPFPIYLIFYSSRLGSFGWLCVWLILQIVPIGGNYLFGHEVIHRSRCRERTPRWEDKLSYLDLFIILSVPAVKAINAMLRGKGTQFLNS